MGVTDNERDRHRFTQRAAQTQHDAADDAGARIRHDDLPDDLPGRGAEAVTRLLQYVRYRLEHVTHDGRNEGYHHDYQHDGGGQNTDSKGWTLEQLADHGQGSEPFDEPRLHVPLQQRRQYEQAPDAEDDARHGGQELDGHTHGPLEPRGRQLGEEDGNAETDRDGDDHGQERSHHRSVHRRQRAVLVGDRIPDLACQEGELEVRKGWPRAFEQRERDAAQQAEHEQCRNQRG